MKSTRVKVYDDEWVRQGVGLIFQSSPSELDAEEDEDTQRIESATWGRFLDYHPLYNETEFYQLKIGDEIKYVSACREHWDGNRNTLALALFPVSHNMNIARASEEVKADYRTRKVFLKGDRGDCINWPICRERADYLTTDCYFCGNCLKGSIPEGAKKWNGTAYANVVSG